MRSILEHLDPRGKDIQVLSRDEGRIVWTDFVESKMDTLKGGTIRSYLGSYEMFLVFVQAEKEQKTLLSLWMRKSPHTQSFAHLDVLLGMTKKPR